MLKIELRHIRFHGYHGIHEEEKKTGGDFEVNLVAHFIPHHLTVLHLDETLDYTKLYELVKKRMDKPTRLIETLAIEIAEEVLHSFDIVENVEVEIKKLNPPIPFFNGYVAAVYSGKRAKKNKK
ncbi:MAG: dihydroneopterin aldolase [Bacteroidetes bacterium]|nr:dihydroneopterin aldolase [Bacteroidota bacterium]